MLMLTRRHGALVPLMIGAALCILVDLPMWWPSTVGKAGGNVQWPRLLEHPMTGMVGNGAALLLILWGGVLILTGGRPELRLARRLKRQGDLVGAADLYLRLGYRKKAFKLLRRARAWTRAAQVAVELGQELDAAGLLRRAGGRQLEDAAQLYRRAGDHDAAKHCEVDLGEWCMREGHYAEAIEAWFRGSEPGQAVRATAVALGEGRLQPSHSAFRAARQACREVRDHQMMAKLYELEGSWTAAARAWRAAGEPMRSADNFRRAGQLDEAARAEAAAGRPRQALQLRFQRLEKEIARLEATRAKGDSSAGEALRLQQEVESETGELIPQLLEHGMESEAIKVLSGTGRREEAIQRLADSGQVTAAAELAQEGQRWDLAAPLLESAERWSEASDIWELAGDMQRAAHCAEQAGDLERALHLYQGSGKVAEAAECLARLGFLQDALRELHRSGLLQDACRLLRRYPGPVPDIPEIILEMAAWARANSNLREAIACLQRAVLGVALRPDRFEPAITLARMLHEAGDSRVGLAHLQRVLDADYSNEAAHQLKQEIETALQLQSPAVTVAVGGLTHVTAKVDGAAEQRYEILSELGRGGMGVVYHARDTRLEREVAIKVLRAASPADMARLEQEARAAATLNHPGIVTVYDFEAGFGGHFIAMEYVPGKGLDELMRSEPASVRANLLLILLRLADAIAFAHQNRVIHRDLKPGNILLTPNMDVKILDFGIAARLSSEGHGPAGVCGTPYYMAPEQIRGEVPTAATDVYAFGATAFHLATGRPPFNSGNIIVAHLNDPPPDPSQLAPHVSPQLAELILRCLAKSPADRFQSGADLRDAIRGLI